MLLASWLEQGEKAVRLRCGNIPRVIISVSEQPEMPGSVAIDKALFDEMVGNAISNALKVRAGSGCNFLKRVVHLCATPSSPPSSCRPPTASLSSFECLQACAQRCAQ